MTHVRKAHRDPLFYGILLVVMLLAWVPGWSIVDRLIPFERHVSPPRVETTMPVAPGDRVTVRWHTRIYRQCEASYSRRLERADGLVYALNTHRGSYVEPTGVDGKVFRTTFRVPPDAPPGRYAYIVATDVRCAPWTHYVQDSPPVVVEVR